MLARLGLVEDDLVALGHERAAAPSSPCASATWARSSFDSSSPQGSCSSSKIFCGTRACAEAAAIVVGVDRDHREQALARRLAARVLQLAERRAGGEGAQGARGSSSNAR